MINNKSRIIYIDVDDTLADTRAAIKSLYEKKTGDKAIQSNTYSKRYFTLCPGWTDKEISKIFSEGEELYSMTKPLEYAVEGVQYLEALGYDIRIVTMNSPESVQHKHNWIKRYFPRLQDKVFYVNWKMRNKDDFCGKSIIDDDFKNVRSNKSQIPILLDFYNIYEDTPLSNNIILCRSWGEVVKNFK